MVLNPSWIIAVSAIMLPTRFKTRFQRARCRFRVEAPPSRRRLRAALPLAGVCRRRPSRHAGDREVAATLSHSTTRNARR